jgi:hypothetical protein
MKPNDILYRRNRPAQRKGVRKHKREGRGMGVQGRKGVRKRILEESSQCPGRCPKKSVRVLV